MKYMISLLMEIIFEYKIYVFMDSCNFCVPTVGQVLCKVLDIEWREKRKQIQHMLSWSFQSSPCHLIELPVMIETFLICAVQYGSCQPHVAIEHSKCG